VAQLFSLGAMICMTASFEPVHSVGEYYDGPRTGVADFHGVRHFFRSVGWPAGAEWDSEDDRFELTPETGGPTVIAHGTFRARQPVPSLPPGVLRPLEVQWSNDNR
jgi:hypothetical protein